MLWRAASIKGKGRSSRNLARNIDNAKFLNLRDEGVEVMVDADINIEYARDPAAADLMRQAWQTTGSHRYIGQLAQEDHTEPADGMVRCLSNYTMNRQHPPVSVKQRGFRGS